MTIEHPLHPDAWVLPPGEPMAIDDIRDALVVREGATFLLTDQTGRVRSGNRQGFGLYHADMRHLSTLDVRLNGVEPVLLLSTAELGFAMEQVFTNPRMVTAQGRRLPKGSVEVRRQMHIRNGLQERTQITNYASETVDLTLSYDFAADFAGIFDVRGLKRDRFGTLRDPHVTDSMVQFSYLGVDGAVRGTSVLFGMKPARINGGSALFEFELPPRGTALLRIAFVISDGAEAVARSGSFAQLRREYDDWMGTCTQATTDNQLFNRVLARSLGDIRLLRSRTEDGTPFTAAGTPWFDALFGRDSCVTAMQLLPFSLDLARSTLQLLAAHQGTELNAYRDEEPGKILHELRRDDLSVAGELPYRPYYGSIDSTPLFLMLLAEYLGWTDDLRLLRELLPVVKMALGWIDEWGDPGASGHTCYEKRSPEGLVNQGWKDSWDAIVHDDGRLAAPPVALAEVQGYVYAARRGLAPYLRRVGEDRLASDLAAAAEQQAARFDADFWLGDGQGFAIALEGTGEKVTSTASNPGHCLWTQIVEPARAKELADALLSPRMFSGWGIRTLSTDNPRFNPIGYHTGSVWPHDNSLIAMGLKKYGFEEQLNRVAGGIFDAASTFPDLRLPELFSGDTRGSRHTPTPYPVACRPQAWAAGAMPLILQAILGLKPEAADKRLRIVNPRLPLWLNFVQLRDLRIGNGTATLNFRRSGRSTSVEVVKTSGPIDVVVAKRWPREG